MRVIKNGKTTFERTCPHCDSVLEIEAKDLMGGDVCEYCYRCIVCLNIVMLSVKAIPKSILEELDR